MLRKLFWKIHHKYKAQPAYSKQKRNRKNSPIDFCDYSFNPRSILLSVICISYQIVPNITYPASVGCNCFPATGEVLVVASLNRVPRVPQSAKIKEEGFKIAL